MLFNSFAFALFLPLVWILYWSLRSDRLRRGLLVVASVVFYGWWDWRFVFLMLGVSVSSWLAALLYQRARDGGRERRAAWIVRIGVALPLLVLAFFKYTLFLLHSFASFMQSVGVALTVPEWNIILPVGISFYTFQALSYLIDVKRGRCDMEPSFWKVFFYIAFFPQLVAGPIVSATTFLPQARVSRRFSAPEFVDGIRLILWGLMLKVVFGDALAAWVDPVFTAPLDYTLAARWAGVLAFYGQIYFDFAGYSIIAIGIGKTFDYTLPENFNTPYVSLSVTEFWRRWHISLSTWLKDYLFIPLGGNRHHYYRNLMLTMLLGGLWHGASWNFVLWGGLHGIALCVHKLWSQWRGDRATSTAWLHVIAAWIATQVFVLITWVPFRAPDLGSTLHFFTTAAHPGALSAPDCHITWPWLVLPPVIDALLHRRITSATPPVSGTAWRPAWAVGAVAALVFLLILALGTWESQSFIYFQF